MPHTVLCIDDDRTLCQIIAKTLVAEGYKVETAHDGEAGVRAFEAKRPDLVLLDLLLPVRDGFDVLGAIRSQPSALSETPALLMSGCSKTPDYEKRARDLRVSGFLTKPVPLDQLLAHVRNALNGAASAEVTNDDESAVPLKGSLVDLRFPSLLHHMHGLRASGALLLRWGKRRKGIQLRDGRPVAIRSNQVTECLGNLLVRMGRIDEPTLKESLRRMKRGEGLQGEILVAMEVLSEVEVSNALKVQAESKLLEIFEWPEGDFELRRGGRLKGANQLSLDSNPASLIIDGVCSRFPLEFIDAELAARPGDAQVVAGESPFYLFQDMTLDPIQYGFLERLRQGAALRDLLGEGELARRMLYGLLATEVVELRAPADPSLEGAEVDAAIAARARLAAVRGPKLDPAEEGIRSELSAMAESMRGADYFGVLSVTREATDEQVRASYVDLAKRTHPDRFSSSGAAVRQLAEEVFGLVSQANEALVDARSREAYRLELAQGARMQEEMEEARRALGAEKEFQKGIAALRARSSEVALEAFREAVDLYPAEGEYLAYLAYATFLGSPDDREVQKKAVTGLRKSAKLAPDSEKPYLLLGQLFKAMNRPENAEKMFLQAVQQKADCLEALRELRLINLRREKQKGLVRRLLRR
jgi:CheY-like chemotaxis protein